MRTIFALLILFSLTIGLQQAQAQSGKSYQEWLKGKSSGGKTASSKAPAKGKAAAVKVKEETPAATPVMAPPSGTFKGTFACSDCQGILIELLLTGDPKDANRTFKLKQTYLGKPADKGVVNSSGKWFLAKGNKQNPDAVILQLIPTAGNIDPMYFLQVSENEVRLLNQQQGEFADPESYSLRKL